MDDRLDSDRTSRTGEAKVVPKRLTDRSRAETSRSIRGTMRQRRNDSAFALMVSSEEAPLAT